MIDIVIGARLLQVDLSVVVIDDGYWPWQGIYDFL